MEKNNTYIINLSEESSAELPMIDIGDGFGIYSFDMTSECEWNRVAADELLRKLAPYEFDGFVTVQTKSCGLTQAISKDYPKYLELAKKIDIEIAVIACVLTEGPERTEYKGIPLVCLDYIPLPGQIRIEE